MLIHEYVLKNKKVDIWAVGCIFAELILRRELFPGNNHIEQIGLIFSIIGSPSKHDLSWITSSDALNWVNHLEHQNGHDLHKIFKNAKPDAIDLIKKMLIINPYKRINVIGCLSHPYFNKLHHPKSEITVPNKAQFRKSCGLTKEFEKSISVQNTFSLRYLMYQTLVDLNPICRKKTLFAQIVKQRKYLIRRFCDKFLYVPNDIIFIILAYL